MAQGNTSIAGFLTHSMPGLPQGRRKQLFSLCAAGARPGLGLRGAMPPNVRRSTRKRRRVEGVSSPIRMAHMEDRIRHT